MKWYNPQTEPFLISGFVFYEKDKVYRRMPLEEGIMPEAVYGLANETAGGQIRFHGRLKELRIQVSLASKPGYYDHIKSPHLATVTRRAFDLYVSPDGKDYIFFGVAKGMDDSDNYYEHTFLKQDEEQEFDFLLNFPLYGGVDKVLIGVDDEARISAPHYHFKDDKKIVQYGTSIHQGACAGRPGMAQSNLLSRLLDREVYNLGFNSNGKAEPEMARILGQIKDTKVLIMCPEGNCPDAQWMNEKLRAFIRVYRELQPDTPIVLMTHLITGLESVIHNALEERLGYREIQERIVEECRAQGDDRIFLYVQDGREIPGLEGHSIWHEGTVDGLHYNDLGYYWTTKALIQFLKERIDL